MNTPYAVVQKKLCNPDDERSRIHPCELLIAPWEQCRLAQGRLYLKDSNSNAKSHPAHGAITLEKESRPTWML